MTSSAPFDQDYDAITGADGIATISISPVTNLRRWTVTQVSVEMPGATGFVTCTMRKNGQFITPLVASGDAAAGDPPILLNASDTLTITWAGAVPGAQARALVLYTEGT